MIPWLGVILGTVWQIVLGMLWYGPLFGKPWMAERGIKPEDIDPKSATAGMILSMVTAFLGSLTLALVLGRMGAAGLAGGLVWGAAIGFLIVGGVILSTGIYNDDSAKLITINGFYRALSFTGAGLLIGLFL